MKCLFCDKEKELAANVEKCFNTERNVKWHAYYSEFNGFESKEKNCCSSCLKRFVITDQLGNKINSICLQYMIKTIKHYEEKK